ncbi:hypothetical protein EHQ53_04925 [Leptospira langatensis]|uniref:Uncharacterized protein n=1 Tax=Leptospira langatensis TaxID=2484983 RepID=A0A5F1ZVR9_9LEPT|nr:hypothetical protein [Leptospira langatensis]TGK00159.1 hypothetical protein EHO57_12785 [Leptospira langatensis]TGL42794.1 hypothetical protein EHQ53_04925 [Leptospira langatensis]
MRHIRLLPLLLLLSCTTVGFHRESVRETYDYGKPRTVRVCVWKDTNVSKERMDTLFDSWNEELSMYRLQAKVSRVQDWQRPGWTSNDIMKELFQAPLPSDCDRILALAGVQFSDLLYEFASYILALFFIPTFEVLGAVDSYTGTRGFVLAHTASLGSLLYGGSTHTMVHEGYHMFGCGHAFFLSECYGKIKDIKAASERSGESFFPAALKEGGFLYSQKDVNLIFLGQ